MFRYDQECSTTTKRFKTVPVRYLLVQPVVLENFESEYNFENRYNFGIGERLLDQNLELRLRRPFFLRVYRPCLGKSDGYGSGHVMQIALLILQSPFIKTHALAL